MRVEKEDRIKPHMLFKDVYTTQLVLVLYIPISLGLPCDLGVAMIWVVALMVTFL